MSGKKADIARVLSKLRVSAAGFSLQKRALSPFVRCVNYHDVPPDLADAFERQLQFYADRFAPVAYADLADLAEGRWSSPKPGLMLSFDDGLRSHADVVAPLLEAYGFPGWFMVPGGFVDTPDDEQAQYAKAHDIVHAGFDYGDPRLSMTWDDARRLSGTHVIGCHSWTHRRLADSLSADDLDLEITQAKAQLETRLGVAVPVFCWVGGEEWSYSAAAARCIRDAGFTMSFMTNNAVVRPTSDLLQIQRTNVEASNSDEIVEFQLSGLMDALYLPKRRRVRKLTSA